MADAIPAQIGSSAKLPQKDKVCEVCKNSPCEKWEECLWDIVEQNGQTIKRRK